ncbi:MAG: ferredoxin [Pseudomonadota bacterium]
MSGFAADVAGEGLQILGTLTARDGNLPEGAASLSLLGPDGPAFWAIFEASPEALDGAPDPLDRWSVRVVGALAERAGGTAIFPFSGPPWHPFLRWAEATGRIYTSPVGLLVHPTEGLWVSFRGAVALPHTLSLPALPSPCVSCVDQPCRSACPAGAMVPEGYDVPKCKSHIEAPEGVACRSGCRVRASCPVGIGRRTARQSAFHMAAFHPGAPT